MNLGKFKAYVTGIFHVNDVGWISVPVKFCIEPLEKNIGCGVLFFHPD